MDMDLHIFGLRMLYLENILNWQRILVGTQEDFQYKLADTSKRLDYLLLYIVN